MIQRPKSKEYGLKNGKVRAIRTKKSEMKYDIEVCNSDCECPLWVLNDIPESRILAIIMKERVRGNYCNILY